MLRALMTRPLRPIAPLSSLLSIGSSVGRLLGCRLGLGLRVALVVSVVAASGCTRRIGNECKLSIDCSLRGERICDLSYLVDEDGFENADGKGECIIEGCTAGSCPNEGVCVQIYSTEFLSVACDPAREDRPGGLDDCDVNEVCLPEGLCADANTARTTCRKECRREGMCREGYGCRPTGGGGVYVAIDPETPQDTEETKICMPDG